MSRNAALAATAALVVAGTLLAAGPATAWPFGRSAPVAASAPAPAVAAPSPTPARVAPDAPAAATAEQRAQAERLDPLARSVFWTREHDIAPTDVGATLGLAHALRDLGQYDQAVQAAAQILVTDPDSVEARIEIAKAHIARGQAFYAVEPLEQARAARPADWQILSLLGVAYEQVQRTDDARATWRQALALSSENPAVLNNLALSYASSGDRDQAEALLRRAVTQPGATLQVRQNLALVLGLQGKAAEAEAILRRNLPPEAANQNLAWLNSRTASLEPQPRTWGAVGAGH